MDIVHEPGRFISRDIARGEAVEHELDAFIQKRHDQRIKAEGERAIEAEVVVFENVLEYGLATLDVAGLDGRMVAQTPSDVHWRSGEQARITGRPDRVYQFDVDSRERIRLPTSGSTSFSPSPPRSATR